VTARPAALSPAITGRGQGGNHPATGQLNPAIPPATATGNRPDAADTDAATNQPSRGHMSGQLSASVSAVWPSTWPRPADPDADTIADTLGWIEGKARAASESATGPVPLLGTAAWCALPDTDPARWAALCTAAAAWFRQYVTTGDRVRSEAREEFERFEAYALERDRVHYAPLRQAANDAAASIERRTRTAARTDLPDRTGPELIAAAHASWGLAPPSSPSAIRRAA
jgi:hypothetical protein